MVEKAPEAFRTISEVSDDLDLPQHVLRFWETKFTTIKPLKRGGGRRYYRPEDIDLLRGIRHLLYSEGFTIKGVQKILREQGARYVAACWEEDAPPIVADPDGDEVREGKLSRAQASQLKAVMKDLKSAQSALAAARRGK